MDILGFGTKQILTFLLVLSRVGGIFTAAPIFGNTNVTPMVRVIIAVCLTLVFLPMTNYSPGAFDLLPFTIAIVKEAVVGLVMGFLVSLLFVAVQMAGAFIDLQIGFGFAAVMDPMIKERAAVIGQLYNMAATLLFLSINAHHLMLRGLADSFTILPLGQMAFSASTAGGMTQAFGVVFLASLKIGAPVAGVIFLTDVSLGILARTVPQLNIFVVGFPAKLAVGMAAVFVVLPVALGVMAKLFCGVETNLVTLLRHLAQ